MKASAVRASSVVSSGKRLDAPFYINDAIAYYEGLKNCPYGVTTVAAESDRVFFGNIFSRQFVCDANHGVPYLRASEIQKADLCDGDLYLATAQANALSYLRLKRGWILVTCSGSLGCCVYADSRFEKLIGTHDLIRIVPCSKSLSAQSLYAFLASKYGFATLTHSQYGSVILHTNPEHISSIRVPIFPQNIQKKITALIDEAVSLREQGDALILKSSAIFAKHLSSRPLPRAMMIEGTKIGEIQSRDIRFDAQFVIGTQKFQQQFSQEKVPFRRLDGFTKAIYIGNRGKRIYTEKGIPFLTTSAALQANPMRSARTISRKNPGLDTFIVQLDDILISRSGTVDTVGHVSIVGEDIAGTAVSDDAIRVVIDREKISPHYVFGYLRSRVAKSNMEHLAYGSAILHINEALVGGLLVPILPDVVMREIEQLCRLYRENYARAAVLENQAIKLVGDEIGSWLRSD